MIKSLKEFTCKNCGYSGQPLQKQGSGGIEATLWILGLLTSGIIIIPAIIYSVWRCSKTASKVCPKCCSPGMIPQDR